jgi:geranylgeranyl pyrophosphate synthase
MDGITKKIKHSLIRPMHLLFPQDKINLSKLMAKEKTSKKEMSIKQHHQITKRISNIFDLYLLREFKKRDDADTLLFLYKKFLKRRVGKEHLFPTLVYIASKLFEVETDAKYSNLMPLMTMAEMTMWWSYGIDWIIDQENMEFPKEVPEVLIASQYLLSEFTYFDLQLSGAILNSYSILLRGVMESFWVDGIDLRITKYQQLQDSQRFWKLYNIRNTKSIAGLLSPFCFELVSQYFRCNVQKETLSRIVKMMTRFGACVQIINDVSDLMMPNPIITSTEKRPVKDYFVDIRDDRLTYPIWLLLNNSKRDNRQLFLKIIKSAKNKKYNKGFEEKVFNYIKEKGIMEEIISFLKKEEKHMRKEIKKLNIKNHGTDLLKILSAMITHNKFLVQIKKDYTL